MHTKNVYLFLLIFVLTFAIYAFFSEKPFQQRNYFVPLAHSFLQGKLDVNSQPILNELVPVNGKYYVVYPPAPAIALMPFVAFWGLNFNQTWGSIFYGALAVAISYFVFARITSKKWVVIALTVLLGFGTNFFFTSLAGTSWYFSHIMVVFFLALALFEATGKSRPWLVALLFSAAFLSRLPVLLAFPLFAYFTFKKNPRDWKLNLLIFFLTAGLILTIFGFYNAVRFGSPFQTGYSLIPGVLNEFWYQKGIFSLSYIPRNLRVAFATMPAITPYFPFFLASSFGLAFWISTPALLLLPFIKFKKWLTLWLIAAVILVFLPSLMHGTPGFTQFGYRFSLDFILFLLILLASAFERVGWEIAITFVAISIAINLWTVILFQMGVFRYF